MQSGKISNKLQTVLVFLAGYAQINFKKPIEVTSLLRTQAKQDAIYHGSAKYRASPWVSVHQVGRGADVSCKGFTDHQAKELVEAVNSAFEYKSRRKTALLHDIGFGRHIHLQVRQSVTERF